MVVKYLLGFCLSSLFLVTSCTVQPPCSIPQGWLVLTEQPITDILTQPIVTQAAINLDGQKIPISQPFSFTLNLCHADDANIDHVTVTAVMPVHLHGMNYTPEVVRVAKTQRYRINNFLFHMPGLWDIVVSVFSEDHVDTFRTQLLVES